jgi:hypothetical protein
LTRRTGKEIALFRGRLNLGRNGDRIACVRQRSSENERSRRRRREFSVAKRGDFGVLKRISRTKTLRKSRRTTKKNVFPRSFFDGLGLLKSSAVSLRTSKRFRSETAENSPFDGKPPNFETGEPEPND